MIEVLLSTMNKEEIDFKFFEERNITSRCTVINQNKKNDSTINLGDNVIINTISKGLSRSRNIGLKNAREEICVIQDDDLVFESEYEEIIERYYKLYPDADIITFLITMGGVSSDRVRSDKVIKHNKKTILNIGSNEITFRRSSVLDSGLMFDERFGLGSGKFESGEENLFLNEAMNKGLKLYHVPIVISNHIPRYGSNAFWGEKLIISKAAFFRAYSKNLWLLYMVYLFIVKRKIIDKDIKLSKYLSLCMLGRNEYDKSCL